MNRRVGNSYLCFCMLAISFPSDGAEPKAATLRSAAAGLFDIGVGISDRIPVLTNEWPLLLQQFSIVTPENCMKPVAVQPTEGQFEFQQADAFVDFARRKHLKVVGHCLVWAKDDRTPPWFFSAVEGRQHEKQCSNACGCISQKR